MLYSWLDIPIFALFFFNHESVATFYGVNIKKNSTFSHSYQIREKKYQILRAINLFL